MNRSPSSWSKPFPILDHPHHMGNDQSSCVKECRGHCYIQTDQTINWTRATAALPSVIGGPGGKFITLDRCSPLRYTKVK
jgi:hypothetical protein